MIPDGEPYSDMAWSRIVAFALSNAPELTEAQRTRPTFIEALESDRSCGIKKKVFGLA